MEPLYRCRSVQDVLLDVLTSGLVVGIPEEKARRPILDQGRDRVVGPLELHLPAIVVIEERGRDLLDPVALVKCRECIVLYGRSPSHGIAVEHDSRAELASEVAGKGREVPGLLVVVRIEDHDDRLRAAPHGLPVVGIRDPTDGCTREDRLDGLPGEPTDIGHVDVGRLGRRGETHHEARCPCKRTRAKHSKKFPPRGHVILTSPCPLTIIIPIVSNYAPAGLAGGNEFDQRTRSRWRHAGGIKKAANRRDRKIQSYCAGGEYQDGSIQKTAAGNVKGRYRKAGLAGVAPNR